MAGGALDFEVRFDAQYRHLQANLDHLGNQALPYAAAVALTRTALAARDDYRKALPSIFDRPTPYTLNSAQVTPARKDNLVAIVDLKDGASKYLGPEILGGQRNMKRSEVFLDHFGLSQGAFTTPGRGAKLDQYGNMSAGQIVQILSALNALEYKSGFQGNRTKRSQARQPKRAKYFVVRSKDTGQPLGIWKGEGGHATPVMAFVRKTPTYQPILPFEKLTRDSFDAHFGPEMDKALDAMIQKFEGKR